MPIDALMSVVTLVTMVGLAVAGYGWGADSITPAASGRDGRSVRDALTPE
ncbi:MAG TPA: hypothetical protein VNG93_13700 [Candidatus Dormibacteraeota bacterium]|nr:hypothetical protein [Candidatus Dormibacteraeota bacterium]